MPFTLSNATGDITMPSFSAKRNASVTNRITMLSAMTKWLGVDRLCVCRLEVKGKRELAFFPGLGRGAVYPGFTYQTEAGTRAAPISFEVMSTNDQ